jgi:hypothetical protein
VNLGELDPQAPQGLDQVIEPAEGFDFVLVIHEKETASGAFLEEDDPFPGARGVLYHMGGADKSFCMALADLLAFHRLNSINDNAANVTVAAFFSKGAA